MINIEEQQNLFIKVAKKISKPITAYAIGGTAMMYHGLKDVTLDIDLVFKDHHDRELFTKAIQEVGYQMMDSVIVYKEKKNKPLMFTLGSERFDLFLINVIDFDFSQSMMKRADTTHQYVDNLILKIANPHDLIIMKCATDRTKDIDDARKIIETTKIDWNTLVEEAKTQILLGKQTAAFDLGEFLEKLKYKHDVDIPQKVLDSLFEIVKLQAQAKQKK